MLGPPFYHTTLYLFSLWLILLQFDISCVHHLTCPSASHVPQTAVKLYFLSLCVMVCKHVVDLIAKKKNKNVWSVFWMYLLVRPTYRNTPAHTGVCCLFTPDLCDGLGLSLYHVSWIRWWLISITYTPYCCLAGLCRQVCVGAEGRGRERRMRYSCMQGCERVFYIAGCRRVWQVCSGVVLNGFMNIGRPFVGTAFVVCEWSASVWGCRHLSVSLR